MTDAEAAVLETARRWSAVISDPPGYRYAERLVAEFALLQAVRALIRNGTVVDVGPTDADFEHTKRAWAVEE